MYESYPSKLLENAVNEFSKLPGIGRKTALRLVLHILKQKETEVEYFSNSLLELKKNIKQCSVCSNISDNDICEICSNNQRNKNIVCVVENIKDVMAIEKTGQFQGLYHVLGGLISPMDGIGPSELTIDNLKTRVSESEIEEIILALSATPEGETTNYYINRKLSEFPIEISLIARGVSIGSELEYADELTLGRSIVNRTKFNAS